MNKPITKKNYLVIALLGLGFVFIHLIGRYQLSDPLLSQNNLFVLSDAFFFPGFILFNFGLIVVVDNHEGFDFLRYSMQKLWVLMRRMKDYDGPKSFYDYRMQAGEREKSKMYQPMMVIGVLFIVINIVFWILLNVNYPNL